MTRVHRPRSAPRAAGRRRLAPAAVLAALVVFALSAGIAAAATYVTGWGSEGSGHGQFLGPKGVALDGHGHVYVLDAYRVQKFTSDGEFRHGWRFHDIDSLHDVAADGHGHVYVAVHGRIDKFTSDGDLRRSWDGGSHPGQWSRFTGVAVDAHGHVYVADAQRERIEKFTSDGELRDSWTIRHGDHFRYYGPHQVRPPLHVAVDAHGHVYVSDSGNDRIEKFTGDGEFRRQWGSHGSGHGEFHHPEAIAVDAHGHVYVADALNDRIQKFTSDGEFLHAWHGPGRLTEPFGLAVDGHGHVYVADHRNDRIEKFSQP